MRRREFISTATGARASFWARVLLRKQPIEPVDWLRDSLNLPLSALITGIDLKMLLDRAFAEVKSSRPMDDAEMTAFIAKTEPVAIKARCELFKTTSGFETAARHPDGLGSDTRNVQKLAPQLRDESYLGQVRHALYSIGVAVTTNCMLPFESRASAVNTTAGFPTGISTMACHLFCRMIGA